MIRINNILLLILVAIVCVGLTSIVLGSSIVKYEEIYTDLLITSGGHAAFAIDKDNIRFGKMSPGDIAERKFVVQTDERVLVNVKIKGNVSDFVSVSENNFLLYPEEVKTIRLKGSAPLGTPQGNYSGYIQIYFLKPWFR